MTTMRVTVEMLDENGDGIAQCSRDDCSECGYARQSKTLEVRSSLTPIQYVAEAAAHDLAAKMAGLNARKRRNRW